MRDVINAGIVDLIEETVAAGAAPAAARKELAGMGTMSRDERITAVTFAVMVAGWIFADTLKINVTSTAFMGLGVLLAVSVVAPRLMH